MFALIAILLPSIFGLKLMDHLLKELNLKDLVLYYGILVLFSQVINNVLVEYYYNITDTLWNSLNIGTEFFSIYSLMAVVINILLALILVILIKNVKFEVEVEDASKNDKDKKQASKNKHFFKEKDKTNNESLFEKVKKRFKKDKNK